ncbi:MAG: hypothetical protein AAB776_03790 [Patescibacteria group bacterium]
MVNRRDLDPNGGKEEGDGTHEHYFSGHAEPNDIGWPDKNREGGHAEADNSSNDADDV